MACLDVRLQSIFTGTHIWGTRCSIEVLEMANISVLFCPRMGTVGMIGPRAQASMFPVPLVLCEEAWLLGLCLREHRDWCAL